MLTGKAVPTDQLLKLSDSIAQLLPPTQPQRSYVDLARLSDTELAELERLVTLAGAPEPPEPLDSVKMLTAAVASWSRRNRPAECRH
jgi:hypothetical protein